MHPRAVVRPLGPLETFSASRHSLGIYKSLANTCQYSVGKSHVAGRTLPTVLENALAHVVLRLAALRVGIVGEDTDKPYFVSVPSINLQEHLSWKLVTEPEAPSRDAELLRILEEHHDQLWPNPHSRPPWKMVVLETMADTGDDVVLEIVFAVHHALADGMSAAIFHSHLLHALNERTTSIPSFHGHVLHFQDPPALVPPKEELIDIKMSWWFFLGVLWQQLAPPWLLRAAGAPELPWAGKPMTLERNETNLRLVVIPETAVQPLLSACRVHGATLTPVLHALVLTSLSRRLQPDRASAFAGSTPISLRPFASLPPGSVFDLATSMCVMVTAQTYNFDVQCLKRLRTSILGRADGVASVWAIAQDVKNSLKARMETLPNDDITGLLSWVSGWQNWWLKKLGKPRHVTWEVSNVGSLSLKGRGGSPHISSPWRIQRSVFSQCAMVSGPAFGANVSGVDGGPITITLSWQRDIVDTELMDGLARDLEEWLLKLGANGELGIFEDTNKRENRRD